MGSRCVGLVGVGRGWADGVVAAGCLVVLHASADLTRPDYQSETSLHINNFRVKSERAMSFSRPHRVAVAEGGRWWRGVEVTI